MIMAATCLLLVAGAANDPLETPGNRTVPTARDASPGVTALHNLCRTPQFLSPSNGPSAATDWGWGIGEGSPAMERQPPSRGAHGHVRALFVFAPLSSGAACAPDLLALKSGP